MRLSALSLLVLFGCPSDQGLESQVEPPGSVNPGDLGPEWRTDSLVQTPNPEVDVLFVVDNSCSMQSSQDELAANFPVFFAFFEGSGIDYHIGVVSTDMTDGSHSGKLRTVSGQRWVDDETADASQVFTQMVQLGTSGAASERGIGAAYAGLETHKDGFNVDFRRDYAGLVIVSISDEEDQSDTITPPEFASYLNGLEADPDEVTYSSIVTMSGFDRGDRYMYVTQEVGGEIWDITEPDWAPVLERIGLSAAGLSRRFYLSRLPVASTLEVLIETGPVTREMFEGTDWTYDPVQNAITFTEYVPEPLSTVKVTYVELSTADQSDDDYGG